MPPSTRRHEVSPVCVEQFTTLTLIQQRMLEEMAEMKVLLEGNGNGRPGLVNDMRTIKDDHKDLNRLVTDYIAAQTKEVEVKKADVKDEKKELLKWRLGVAAVVITALVTTALGVFQSWLVAQLVNNIK